jgi:hypothetical protein
MTDKQEHYRAKAQEALKSADRATTDSDKAAWLQLADGWMSLLPKQPIVATEGIVIQIADEKIEKPSN